MKEWDTFKSNTKLTIRRFNSPVGGDEDRSIFHPGEQVCQSEVGLLNI
jgi:hypothetical protein